MGDKKRARNKAMKEAKRIVHVEKRFEGKGGDFFRRDIC